MTVLVAALAVLVVILAVVLAYRSRTPAALRQPQGGRRILLPFVGSLDERVLNAAIRISRAESATLVPAYLLIVPLEYAEDAPLAAQVGVAMPLLEAVERAALRAGVAVDARIEKGRAPTHALQRLWDVEAFDRIIVPAAAVTTSGFTTRDLAWILANAPIETLVLKPSPDHVPSVHRRTAARGVSRSRPCGRSRRALAPRAPARP